MALPVPDKGRYAPPVHMIKLTATLLARSAFQRGPELPDWRVSRPADGVERQARSRLAAVAFHIQPPKPAVEALPDRWRRLCWPAVAFHLNRPRVSFGTVCLTGGFLGSFAGTPGAIFALIIWPPQITSRDLVPMVALQRALRAQAMPLGFEARGRPLGPTVRQRSG